MAVYRFLISVSRMDQISCATSLATSGLAEPEGLSHWLYSVLSRLRSALGTQAALLRSMATLLAVAVRLFGPFSVEIIEVIAEPWLKYLVPMRELLYRMSVVWPFWLGQPVPNWLVDTLARV